MRVLIVEDDFASRELLRITTEKEGYECEIAEDGEQGLAKFHEHKPDVVISDVRMPKMDGMELLETIRKDAKDIFIIIVTGHGTEELALKALQLGANNYIKKPLDLSDLKVLLRRFYNIIKSKELENNIPDFITNRHFELEFNTDVDLVPAIVHYLIQKTGRVFTNKEKIQIELGLSELIINAIEHGNLAISNEEKNQALNDNKLSDLYKERMSIEAYKNKKVLIQYLYENDTCSWKIEDQGEGFNWKHVPAPTQNSLLQELHGRGIFLSKLQFDKLEYEGKGNIVQIEKTIKKNKR